MYEGREKEARREAVEALDYPHWEVISPGRTDSLDQVAGLMTADSEICVFWADDEKPVPPDFLQKMVQPLLAEGRARADMHLWSGNAVALPRAALQKVQEGEFRMMGNSFMKLALLFLDVGSAAQGVRAPVAFSSTERLAPLCAEPAGRVC
jgi:hypothetical protein